jgi:hypothetical protein
VLDGTDRGLFDVTEHDYYISVEDSSGRIRRGWLLEDFGYMGFGDASYRTEWEDVAAPDPL